MEFDSGDRKPDLRAVLYTKGEQQQRAFAMIDIIAASETDIPGDELLATYVSLASMYSEGTISEDDSKKLRTTLDSLEERFGPWTDNVISAWSIRTRVLAATSAQQPQ